MATKRQTDSATPVLRNRILLVASFIIAYLLLMGLVAERLEDHAMQLAESQVKKFMMSYRSVRRLVRDWHKPEIYRLQDNGELRPDYFSPYLLSTTFNARGFLNFLNEELEKVNETPVRFKLASDNPRNPINQATSRELELLNAMRRGEMTEYKTVYNNNEEGQVLLYAVATDPVEAKCLRCHGDPDDAPGQLLEMYGDKGGFNESPGKIRAVLSMQVSMEDYLARTERMLVVIGIALFLVLSSLLTVFMFFFNRMNQQRLLIESQKVSLEALSRTDKLTTLLNRHGFEYEIQPVMKLVERYHEPLSLIILDLDNFKRINDTFGHAAGDEVLKAVAASLLRIKRGSDILCRWGGEEFLLVMPRTNLPQAHLVAERMREAIAGCRVAVQETELQITASLGMSTWEPAETLDDLVARADQALYRAKQAGKNRVEAG